MVKESNFAIILFYKYIEIDEPEKLKSEQIALATKLQLKGRVIVAKEGINATLEGTTENIEKYLEVYLSDIRFSDTHIKKSVGTGSAFPKLSVKLRKEIVTLGLENDIDPNKITGKHLKPEELKKWYEEGKEFYVVDMRNDYEFKVGKFKDSVLMPVQNFRDIPASLSHIESFKDKTVLTVCTGGVRCEKVSGLLVREGFKDAYQLDGGIVSYMEKFPGEEFEGTLYVFDKRITTDFDSKDNHVVVGKCDKCEEFSERYVNCRNPECNKHFICCESCSEDDGRSFCNPECRDSILVK
ncbi:MAG: rhodanese-related sulfurtransferase [Candidatus Zambryskibacteria bacterium]|nr:rhodanese-related sulfurtransferase [Candidatus Zambryskibacteria bacterium]